MDKKIIKRDIFAKISQHLEKPEITLILGPRQSGKTTLLMSVKEYLEKEKNIPASQIRYFNLDIIDDYRFFEDQSALLQFIKRETQNGKNLYLLIDEVQRVNNAGLFFKGLYDARLPVKFILTGSSALEIKAKIHEPLTGRKRVFYLLPFSFAEFLRANNPQLISLLGLPTAKIIYPELKQLTQLFSDYLISGGYPAVVLSPSFIDGQNHLKEILSSYIEKDIVGFLKYQDRTAFLYLLKLLADQTGSLVNFNELARHLNISRATVERYFNAMEATFVSAVFRPFFNNLRKTIRKMPKIYFLDTGLRNAALQAWHTWLERTDQGALLETFCARIIWEKAAPSGNLFFYRSTAGAEADFVWQTDNGLYLIESKLTPPSRQQLKTLLRIAELLSVKKIFIITLHPAKAQQQNISKKISYLYPWELVRGI